MLNTQQQSPDLTQGDEQRGQPISRRRFLETSVWACAGVVGLTLAGVTSRMVVGNALEPVDAQWVQVGEIASLPAGEMHQATFSLSEKDAWRTVEHKGVVYAITENGTDYTVFSGVCTHLGCNVHWENDSNEFFCPCHSGYFSRNGDVTGGPPLKPLERLSTKIEDGILYAQIGGAG